MNGEPAPEVTAAVIAERRCSRGEPAAPGRHEPAARTAGHRMTARLGSLCSGIGGLEMGVERALGARTVWQSEIDPHASQILARHWPGVPNLGDLTAIDWTRVEPVDLLTAGYPCQPFSHAGLRQGASDVRHLWPAVAAAIRRLRPRFVLLENVSGHLSLGFGRILGDLADLGFDARWQVLSSSEVGAPHLRRRVFIAAHAQGERRGRGRRPGEMEGVKVAEGASIKPCRRGDAFPADTAGDPWGFIDRDSEATTADPDGERREGAITKPFRHHGRSDSGPEWGAYAPAVARWEQQHGPAPAPADARGRLNPAFVEWMMGYPAGWVDGLTRTAALRCLGNSVQPQVSELAARLLLASAAAP